MGAACSAKQKFPLYLSLSANRMNEERTRYEKLFPVWAIALTHNGKQLAAASSDNKIHLWCLVTYQLLISLTGHGDTIWCVQYSPDCSVLASASSDGTVRLWEVDTGFPINILRAHANWVWHLQFAPNTRNFVSGGADTRLFLWNVDSQYPLTCVNHGHSKSVTGVAFNASDARKMVTTGADGVVCCWKIDWEGPTCTLRAKLEGHLGTIHCCAISPSNQNLIVTAGEDCVVRVWNMNDLSKEAATGSLNDKFGYNLEHHILSGHTETVWRCAFSQCGKLCATVASDMTVRVWNIGAQRPSLDTAFKAHESWIRDVVFSRDNKLLYTASTDGLVSIWRVPPKYHLTLAEEDEFDEMDG